MKIQVTSRVIKSGTYSPHIFQLFSRVAVNTFYNIDIESVTVLLKVRIFDFTLWKAIKALMREWNSLKYSQYFFQIDRKMFITCCNLQSYKLRQLCWFYILIYLFNVLLLRENIHKIKVIISNGMRKLIFHFCGIYNDEISTIFLSKLVTLIKIYEQVKNVKLYP